VRIEFSEPIDVAFSRAELLTGGGSSVPIAPITTDAADQKTLVVKVLDPAALVPGTYVLVWRVLSAADGHATSGTLPFSVGTGQVPTGIGSLVSAGRPAWWRVLVRWVELASMLVFAGGFAFGGIVATPFRRSPAVSSRLAERWTEIWQGSALLLAIGLGLTLVDQGLIATGAGPGDPPSIAIYRRIVFHSTFGTAWLIRVALFVGLIAAGHLVGRRGTSATWPWVLGVVGGGGLLLTVPLAGHAAGEANRTVAITTDWLHLFAAAVWLGGLAYLLAALVESSRRATAEVAAVAARVVTRFSGLALCAVCALLATGLVNAALHVSGPRALRSQDYGVTLIVKHVVVAIVLVAAAVNLLVNRPRLRSLAALGELGAIGRQLRATELVVAVELVLGGAIVLAAAALTELPPADAPLATDVAARTIVVDRHAVAGDLQVWLLGRLTGNPDDRFTVAVTGADGEVPAAIQRLIVEASVAADGASDLTTDRFDAQPLAGSSNSFAFPAVRLALQGVWDVKVIVRRAGLEDVKGSFSVDTRQAGVPPPRAVNDAWRLPRFTFGAWALLALAAIVSIGGVIGVRRLPGLEPIAAGLVLTMVALIAAGFTVSAVRQTIPVTVDTALANPMSGDAGSVQRGAAIYAANCVLCHGAAGAGVVTTDPTHAHGSAADLTDRRSRGERDGDLYHAVTNGVPGSAMPAYDWALSEDERWDVVNYVRQLQRAAGG
jgi:copper transport protein